MRGLRKFRARLRRQRERGAVATLIAILLAGGVVIGMLAISVDLGNIAYERSQVQNGADATSLALAGECAADAANCDPETVDDLLGGNARDAAAQYDNRTGLLNGACARGETSQVGPLAGIGCAPGDMADLGQCPPLPDWLAAETSIPYVETYAATETATGDDELFLPFSRVLAGGEAGDAGVSACARAAWGSPGSTGPTLPITIGKCDWANKTAVDGEPGLKYAPPPPYTPAGGSSTPTVPSEIAEYATGIFLHTTDEEHTCKGSPGHAYPGGFSWLANSDCVAVIEVGGTDGAPGKSEACEHSELNKYLGTEVFIPIHGAVTGEGSGGKYDIVGVASFYFAGWKLSNKSHEVYEEPEDVCTGKKCDTGSVSYIWGWFTSGQLPVGSIDPDAEDLGVTIIKPAG